MTDKSTALAEVRRSGSQALAHQQATVDIVRQIDGMEWGSGNDVIRGAAFSRAAKWALARYAETIGADLQTQVDMLGGKPYPNAKYYKDRAASEPGYLGDEQIEISEVSEQKLRALATERRQAYEALKAADSGKAAEQLTKALDFQDRADYIAIARANWSPPEWATHVYETTIRRFASAAPLEAIMAGEIPHADAMKWVIEVKECNWAGNRPPKTIRKRDGGTFEKQVDPVGNDEPEKTARTRSFRRCAEKAFSTFRASFREQIERAEQIIEAEFEIIQEDRAIARASLPSGDGPQAVATGNGEPEAASTEGARPLPVEGEDGQPVEEGREVSGRPEAEPGAADTPDTSAGSFDATDARKALFATLHSAGVADGARKEWATKHGLPASTKNWGKEHYEKAMEVLYAPVRDDVLARVASSDEVNLEDLSLTVLGQAEPEYLSHYKALQSALDARGIHSVVDPGEDLI
jgi:hypothetical protein